jgi:hypothetical protein
VILSPLLRRHRGGKLRICIRSFGGVWNEALAINDEVDIVGVGDRGRRLV